MVRVIRNNNDILYTLIQVGLIYVMKTLFMISTMWISKRDNMIQYLNTYSLSNKFMYGFYH